MDAIRSKCWNKPPGPFITFAATPVQLLEQKLAADVQGVTTVDNLIARLQGTRLLIAPSSKKNFKLGDRKNCMRLENDHLWAVSDGKGERIVVHQDDVDFNKFYVCRYFVWNNALQILPLESNTTKISF